MWTCIGRNARAQPCHRFESADGHEAGSVLLHNAANSSLALITRVAADKGVRNIVIRRAGWKPIESKWRDHVLKIERTSGGVGHRRGRALTAPSTRSLVGLPDVRLRG